MTRAVALYLVIVSPSQIVQSSLQIISIPSRCYCLFLEEAAKGNKIWTDDHISNRSTAKPPNKGHIEDSRSNNVQLYELDVDRGNSSPELAFP